MHVEKRQGVPPEAMAEWLRCARERATELDGMATDRDPLVRARALGELSDALRDSLEEIRLLGDQLKLLRAELCERSDKLLERSVRLRSEGTRPHDH